jgi:Exopolysaccharide biosynthesis protein YbjH
LKVNKSLPKLLLFFTAEFLYLNTTCFAQISPSGYSGAINTPTAQIIPLGSIDLSLTNNIPEVNRQFSGGMFGSSNLGLGPLSGLEVSGRLTNDGDIYCNQNEPNCFSSSRDLSINTKYQIPLQLPYATRVAIGATDFLGAAKNYSGHYAVGTSSYFKDFEITSGVAKADLPNSYLNSLFFSTSYLINQDLRISLERDSREIRAGGSFNYYTTPNLSVYTVLSIGKGVNNTEQNFQISAGLNYYFNGKQKEQVFNSAKRDDENNFNNTKSVVNSITNKNSISEISPSDLNLFSENIQVDPLMNAKLIADKLEKAGFGQINIFFDKQHNTWLVKTESIRWRKNQLEAMGVALSVFLKLNLPTKDTIQMTLTYLQNPVLTSVVIYTDLIEFQLGNNYCNFKKCVELYSGDPITNLNYFQLLIKDQNPIYLRPQIEIKPAINYVIGNEYGLYNYSLGASTGWEVPLNKGLLWSGAYVSPLLNSSQYVNGEFSNSKLRNELVSNYVSLTSAIQQNTWIELTAGMQDLIGVVQSNSQYGGQIELDWLNAKGTFRIQTVAGDYFSPYLGKHYRPGLGSTRYTIIPGLWSLDLTGGKFYNGDKGFQVTSNHWFGDYRLSFYYRDSGNSSPALDLPKTQFVGFQILLPFGPRAAYDSGPIQIRGGDHLSLNIESVVHQNSNTINGGYGIQSVHQHGLYKDLMDYDRNGVANLDANLNTLRNGLYLNEKSN